MTGWQIGTALFFGYAAVVAALPRGLDARRRVRTVAGAALGGVVLAVSIALPLDSFPNRWLLPPALLLLGYWTSGLLFVAPMLLLFLLFRFVPAIGALFLSMTDYRISGKWDFIAFDNYTRLLSDHVFHEALVVTITYTVIFVPLTVLLSLGTAVLLHQVVWRRGFFRGVFFLPYVTSIVLAAVIWKWIYDVQDGLLNAVLGLVGVGPVDFLGQSGTVLRQIVTDPSGAPYGEVKAWSCGGDASSAIAELRERQAAMQTEADAYRAAHPIGGAR